MKEWQERLTPLIREFGGSLVGYASLSDVPEAKAAGFTGAVSIAVALKPSIVRELGAGPTLAYYIEYQRVNGVLDHLDQLAADWLIAEGYEAHPLIRANVAIDWEALTTLIPHKTVAIRAGHGWIGRSALVVTPQYGSAVRFSTVLTNAPIDARPPVPDGCGTCRACKDACPATALAGIPWSAQLQRKDYYDAFACKSFAGDRCRKLGVDENICGICIHACPYSQKFIRTNSD